MITPNELMRLMLIPLVINVANMWLLVRWMRIKHPSVWIALGRPVMFESRKSMLTVLRFIGFHGDFRHLNDRVLVEFVYVHRVTAAVFLFGFAGVFALAF